MLYSKNERATKFHELTQNTKSLFDRSWAEFENLLDEEKIASATKEPQDWVDSAIFSLKKYGTDKDTITYAICALMEAWLRRSYIEDQLQTFMLKERSA